ncbi:hypothetical protein EPIR_3200 [Erwinia piriflorinigrans CFBP 5888]|uniref:Uncharacterized protein n=1 Tax=Erwinia piriflorinigrans CFBP 5888 TaxID=1161919 RepID=V5ZB17_9GAMM|nr:hypothetical protein EPIR_3200 [Erwinia piriflorinigrans CFBP 5888]
MRSAAIGYPPAQIAQASYRRNRHFHHGYQPR